MRNRVLTQQINFLFIKANSILAYVAASKTIDFLLHGIEEYTATTIISAKNEEIKEAIINRLHRGVTVY